MRGGGGDGWYGNLFLYFLCLREVKCREMGKREDPRGGLWFDNITVLLGSRPRFAALEEAKSVGIVPSPRLPPHNIGNEL